MERREGPGGAFLNALGRADALIIVARAFEDPSVPHPEGSVLSSFTTGQLDSLPEAIAVRKNTGMRVDSLVVRFGQDYLMLQDIAALALIRDNLGKRLIRVD